MLLNRVYLKKLFKRGNSTRRSRFRKPRNDDKNFIAKPLGISSSDERESKKRKLRHPSVDHSKDRVRKKRKMTGNNRVDDINDGVDIISELPEPIIHLIFSFIRCPKDVVRTSILSKKWKSMFNSYPSFDFDEKCFRMKGGVGKHNRIKAREIQKKKFKKYVDNSLVVRLQPLPCIDKFKLYVTNMDDKRWDCIGRWIRSAVDKNVKELEILVAKGKNYILPDFILTSTSITCLKVSACIFNYSVMKLCNLRILSLKDTMVSYRMIQKLEDCCPMIEDLRLVHCNGPLYILRLAFSKLRRVEVHECKPLICIEVEAPNVESLWYHAMKNKKCSIELKGCRSLKHITLKDSKMTDKMFMDYFSKCPLLETLVLQECRSLERLTFLSQKLKSLALIECGKLQEVNIDAPNLCSFEYSGRGLPFASMNLSGLHEAKFSFGSYWKTSEFLVGNESLFENFFQSNGFTLITHSKQDMKIFGEPREARLVNNSFCKLELTASSTIVRKIVNDWLHECCGEQLTLLSPSSELLQLIGTMIKSKEGHLNCCSFYKKKCWRHHLEDVNIQNSSQPHKTHYEFKWRSALA